MKSKLETLKVFLLDQLEKAYDQAKTKTELLFKLFGTKHQMIGNKIRGMKKEGKPLTEWDVKYSTIEKMLDSLGYTVIPVVLPKDDQEKIEKFEKLSLEYAAQAVDALYELVDEINNKSRTRRTTESTVRRRKNDETDEDFLAKLKQLTSHRMSKETSNVKESVDESNEEVKEQSKKLDVVKNEKSDDDVDDIFDI
jgi:pyruvate/2-oxoacid:ferredoxin oxidoreductase beta subunit